MRRGIYIAVAIIIAAAAGGGLYLIMRPRAGHIEEGVYVGMRAPDFTVTGVDGSTFKLSEHRGEIVVVEFSTMWCPYCTKQIEAFRKLAAELREGVYLVSIDVDPSEKPSGEWVKQMGITWFYGHSPEAGILYKVTYVPMVIVVDDEGIIRYRGAYTPYDKLKLIIQQLGG